MNIILKAIFFAIFGLLLSGCRAGDGRATAAAELAPADSAAIVPISDTKAEFNPTYFEFVLDSIKTAYAGERSRCGLGDDDLAIDTERELKAIELDFDEKALAYYIAFVSMSNNESMSESIASYFSLRLLAHPGNCVYIATVANVLDENLRESFLGKAASDVNFELYCSGDTSAIDSKLPALGELCREYGVDYTNNWRD